MTNHLLDVCQHPHIRMREWGVEAMTYLVKSALQYKYKPPLKDSQVSVKYSTKTILIKIKMYSLTT